MKVSLLTWISLDTYSTYARGLDCLLVTNHLLDLTPLGRQKINWKRHDEYEAESK
jgi:predicted dithiol-disulfide oxidoreductase (DUF899 family)